ncbi:MAG: ArnT family glycosyltransferase [Anaerolineae bacterium]
MEIRPGAERLINSINRLILLTMAILFVFTLRLVDLGGYLIVDETDRWRWAEQFYRALIAGDPAATLVGDGYPGIVPVWVQTLWLLGESVRRSLAEGQWFSETSVYMLFHVWSRVENLPLQRLPIALFNGLLVLLIAIWVVRLYGWRVGALALVLVALDPFLLADSRVNRAEAIFTGLFTLSILSLQLFGQTRRSRWLVVSGFLGGLAWLTKIQGLAMLPAVGLILLFQVYAGPSKGMHLTVRRLLSAGRFLAIWLLAAIVAWCVLWPAMWVRPVDVFQLVYDYATRKAGAEGVNVFFAGQHFLDTDPGPLFYPIVLVLRTTPLTLTGLVLVIVEAVRRLSHLQGNRNGIWRARALPLGIAIIAYAAIMTFGSHKQDRYLMPIFPLLDILAALGWLMLWERVLDRYQVLRHWMGSAALIGGLLAIHLVSVLPYHPYYYPYFNPLAGGGTVGARMLRVGWGEGMDLVAQYLNQKPNAANLSVAARWHRYMVGFRGKTLPFDQSGRWTRADYVVLYIQQVQRMLDPSPGIIRYFQNLQPEHVIFLNGIAYAWVYRSPFTRAAQPRVSRVPGYATLFGFRWEPPDPTDAHSPGIVRAIWQRENDEATTQLVATLSDGHSNPSWQECKIAPGFESIAAIPGEVLESVCVLRVPQSSTAPTAYDVRFGMRVSDGSVIGFSFPEAWQSLVLEPDGRWRIASWMESVEHIAARDIPEGTTMADRYFDGRIRLAGYALGDHVLHAGQSLEVTLYWQALEPPSKDYIVFLHLFGLDGTEVGQTHDGPSPSTSQWLPGQVVRTTHRIATKADLPVPAVATLEVGLYDQNERALPITDRYAQRLPAALERVKFIPVTWPSETPPIVDNVRFDGGIILEGHTSLPQVIDINGANTLMVELWWRAIKAVEQDYIVFVHLVDEHDNIVAQADGVPVAGRYPTSAWSLGERIVDTRTLLLPKELGMGTYQLVVGLYNPVDGQRLSIEGSGAEGFRLGILRVKPS